MSRKKAKFDFNVIESIDNTFLKKTILKVPSYFKGGNNEINKIEPFSNQTDKIKYLEAERKYEIKFIDINSNYGEFII